MLSELPGGREPFCCFRGARSDWQQLSGTQTLSTNLKHQGVKRVCLPVLQHWQQQDLPALPRRHWIIKYRLVLGLEWSVVQHIFDQLQLVLANHSNLPGRRTLALLSCLPMTAYSLGADDRGTCVFKEPLTWLEP